MPLQPATKDRARAVIHTLKRDLQVNRVLIPQNFHGYCYLGARKCCLCTKERHQNGKGESPPGLEVRNEGQCKSALQP